MERPQELFLKSLMSLFNLLQFGSIGEEELTIAEIVQGMHYEGYDFIHSPDND